MLSAESTENNLPWKNVDDYLDNTLPEKISNTDIIIGRDIIAIDKHSKHFNKEHRFSKLKKIALKNYTPRSAISKKPNFDIEKIKINYNPYMFNQNIPWLNYNPFARRWLNLFLNAGGRTIEQMEDFGQSRNIRILRPKGEAPKGGFPVVLMSHGFKFPHKVFREQDAPYGGYNEARTIHGLLENNIAVILLEAEFEFAWLTNFAGFRKNYKLSSDYFYLKEVIEQINLGSYGNLNSENKFALGISSGGYNTSRLANTFPSEFKAVGIQVAGYMENLADAPMMTSLGHVSKSHPPTLFINGIMDPVVPIDPALNYFKKLKDLNIESELILFNGGHMWNDQAPSIYTEFFKEHID